MKILNLYLFRTHLKEKYTIGNLYHIYSDVKDKNINILSKGYLCDTLEDKFRGNDLKGKKVYGETCIPEGIYQIKMTYSNKFKKELPELLNVPYFEGIRIHKGNSAGEEILLKYQEIDKIKQILDVKEYIEVVDD